MPAPGSGKNHLGGYVNPVLIFGHLRVDKDGNTEIYGGGAGSDCEVVFRIQRKDDEILRVQIWGDDILLVRIFFIIKIRTRR
jgi:hypothetical protein